MNESWIKLFRKFLDWEWFHDDAMVKMWLYLLLMANYEDRKWQGGVVKRGELVTSIPTLMRDLNRTKQQIRTSLLRLVNTKEITLKTTHRYTIITICKYDCYQEFNFGFQPAEQHTDNTQITHQQHTDNTQITLPKEIKKVRNKDNNIDANASTSGAGAPDPEMSSQESVDFIGLMKFFNRTMEEAGAIIPRCKSCDGKRREFVRARIREHGLNAVYEMITKASQSDFLNGKSRSGWIADFTWLFRPSNFQKVLEGNYDNRNNHYQPQNNAANQFTDPRQAEREQLATGYAATIARLAAEDDARAAELRKP